jgi:cellulose synthase/poly-beta-1,6-N-acetylglucosamine synthase-like glycosyltransferase
VALPGVLLLPHLESVVFGVAGVVLIGLTLPLLLELALLSAASLLPARRPRNGADSLSPIGKLVVVVPSHNEEGSIGECLSSLAASACGATGLLVIAHNCQDRTAEFARAAGANVFELNDPAQRGKGHALVKGFELAFAEYGADAVMIVDADSTVSADLVERVREHLSHAQVVQCRYETLAIGESSRMRLRALASRCMNVVRPRGRQRLGLSCGIFGNGFAFRKEVLDRVPYSALSVVEDLEFHLSLLAAGIRTEFVGDAVVSAAVPPNATGAQTQSARWEGGRLRMLRARGPYLLGQVLRGRIRFFEPMIDLAGLPQGQAAACLVLLLLLPVPAMRWYAACGFAILAFHLLAAIRFSPEPAADLRSLVSAPLYVVSKIAMIPAIMLTARSRSGWIRTARVAPAAAPGETIK